MSSTLNRLVQVVRSYLKDFPALNRLVAVHEFSDTSIVTAILDAVDDFNLDSPLAPFSVDTFPSVSLLRMGATKYLMESATFLQTRNHLTYSDGQGVQVNSSDRGPTYLNIVQKLSQEWEVKKQRMIVKLNVKGMMGSGVYSDFRQLDEDSWRND